MRPTAEILVTPAMPPTPVPASQDAVPRHGGATGAPRRSRRVLLVVTALALVVGITGFCQVRQAMSPDECTQWSVVFNGYGEAGCHDGLLRLRPTVATSADRTHAGLATSTTAQVRQGAVQTISTTMTTVSQLRQGQDPNTWEVAWLLWSYTDNNHFYALVLKPNGWEVSKQDPAYEGNQKFLYSGHTPTFPPGSSYEVSVRIDTTGHSARFEITVNGESLGDFEDTESPYYSGAVAAYCEDAEVTFTPVEQEEP